MIEQPAEAPKPRASGSRKPPAVVRANTLDVDVAVSAMLPLFLNFLRGRQARPAQDDATP